MVGVLGEAGVLGEVDGVLGEADGVLGEADGVLGEADGVFLESVLVFPVSDFSEESDFVDGFCSVVETLAVVELDGEFLDSTELFEVPHPAKRNAEQRTTSDGKILFLAFFIKSCPP